MGRQARQYSKTGLYHIMLRGINHCNLFEETADYEKFLLVLREAKKKIGFQLLAYCLMSNHVHLLIREQSTGDITAIMKSLLTPYAGWFNKKYQRIGSLIANRYKSECIYDDKYLITLLRYIHINPVKAGIVQNIADYQWSSYYEYIHDAGKNSDRGYIYSVLSPDKIRGVKQFMEVHEAYEDAEATGGWEDGDYIPSDSRRRSEKDVRRVIKEILSGIEPNVIIGYNKADRNAALRKLRDSGLSIRQIERATGISKGIISKS